MLRNFYPSPPPHNHISPIIILIIASHPCFSPQLAGIIFAACASDLQYGKKTYLAHAVYTPGRILPQSLSKISKVYFGSCVQLYSSAETPFPAFGLIYEGAMVSQDRRHFFCKPLNHLFAILGTYWSNGDGLGGRQHFGAGGRSGGPWRPSWAGRRPPEGQFWWVPARPGRPPQGEFWWVPARAVPGAVSQQHA